MDSGNQKSAHTQKLAFEMKPKWAQMQILFSKLVDKYLIDSPVLTQWIVPTGGEEKVNIDAKY